MTISTNNLTLEEQVASNFLSATTVPTPRGISSGWVVTGTLTIENECGINTRSFVATDINTPDPTGGVDVGLSGWGSLFILNSYENINSYLVIGSDQIGLAEI